MQTRHSSVFLAIPLSLALCGGASAYGFETESEDGAYKLKTGIRMQARFAYEEPEEDDNSTAFSIPRARITLSGHAYTKRLGYKLQTDFGKGFVTLKDFYLDYQLVDDRVRLRVGQYKPPFSRQQITSSGKQEFVDRAITDKAFGGSRDIGVMIHNGSKQIEYAFGVFNGTGDKARFSGDVLVDPTSGVGEVDGGKFTNVPDQVHPMIVARIGYNHGKLKGYSEADLEGGGFRFGAANSTILDFDASGNDGGSFVNETDFIVKISGFSATAAVYAARIQSGDEYFDQSAAAAGLQVQAGYVIAGKYQPVVRYAVVNPEGSDNNTVEMAFGLAWYFHGHKVKWQTDVALLNSEDPAGDVQDTRIRTQAQFSF